ncbi:DoxX family protein [Congregibacter litoralis]|uniref:Putative membrane protein n=1 Tax=Congregibacter litoralis KT71 TaxID=314285 RepID=A4ABR3_9GAMM|nr:DoxX family protein [Congregibacter litoralis]EAQ96576.1 putative membrane protein [Congregibacter litoralis KT71]
MISTLSYYDRATSLLSGIYFRGTALLLCRVSLAGVFWRAGRTKVEEGTLLTISDTTGFLFEQEYSGVPLPSELSMYLATYGEHLFPILLVLGLATRFSALALLLMTLTIQFFVYPDAWWQVHSLWAALSLMLLSEGGGGFSLDHLMQRFRRTPAGATA